MAQPFTFGDVLLKAMENQQALNLERANLSERIRQFDASNLLGHEQLDAQVAHNLASEKLEAERINVQRQANQSDAD